MPIVSRKLNEFILCYNDIITIYIPHYAYRVYEAYNR